MKSASPTVAAVANVQRQPWRDDDALAQPGQALSAQELAHLTALANGNAPSAITAMVKPTERSGGVRSRSNTSARMMERLFEEGMISAIGGNESTMNQKSERLFPPE